MGFHRGATRSVKQSAAPRPAASVLEDSLTAETIRLDIRSPLARFVTQNSRPSQYIEQILDRHRPKDIFEQAEIDATVHLILVSG